MNIERSKKQKEGAQTREVKVRKREEKCRKSKKRRERRK